MKQKARGHRASMQRAPAKRRERGAVLIFGLVILLVVTMVGISGQQGTVLQERLAGNLRQNQIALQAAEAALQVGLDYVSEKQPEASSNGSNYVWTACTVGAAEASGGGTNDPCTRFDTVLANWKLAPAQITAGAAYEDVAAQTNAGFGGAFPGVAAQPRLYIEQRKVYVHEEQDVMEASREDATNVSDVYTVTAIGFGGNEQSRAVIQSTIEQ